MEGMAKIAVDEGPVERALRDSNPPPDEFQYDQDKLNRTVGLPGGDFDEWLDSLSSVEARRIYNLCDRVASEHRRRAESAGILQEHVRKRFLDTAHYDAVKTAEATPALRG